MPSKKKKYNARFPPGRIKKIMQTDEEVGKVAKAVPIIISRTLELFVHSLLTKTMQITSAKQAKTLSPAHMKQCIQSEARFDFLKDLVKNIADVSVPDDESNFAATLNIQPIAINNAPMATFAPKSTTVVTNAPNDGTSFIQKPSRRNSNDKGNILNLVKTEATNEAVLSCNVPKFSMPVPTSFNASQPNFYTEVNPSDNNVPRCSSFSQPVSKFACTASLDEDYDT